MAKDPAFLFYPGDWKCCNTYDTNYSASPPSSGIYMIVLPKIHETTVQYDILYVGSTKNLLKRYNKHEVYRILTTIYGYVQFYFKEENHFYEKEKYLIGLIQPKYNKQWR